MSKKSLLICIALAAVLGFFQTSYAALVGYWRFDDAAGTTAADSSGYGHDAVVEGVTDSVWVEGQLGGGAAVGNGAWVSVPPEAWDPIETQFTVAFWAFGYAGLGNNWGFFATGGGANRVAGCHIPWSDGNVYFDTADSAGQWSPERISTALGPGLATGVWNHWAFTKNADTGEKIIYLNGEPFHSGTDARGLIAEIDTFAIGSGPNGSDQYLGAIDDFRLYDQALLAEEIQAVMTGAGAAYPLALSPDPKDGAMIEATWANLSWRPGSFAVSHDVYLGTNFDDVNSGTADTFIGNQASTMLIVGFAGFPIADGLVPGTTYYWRIDEVNDANAASPWKGDTWSFLIPPKTGYNPIPADGAKFVETEAPTLSWTPGFDAKLHTVYFGDNFADVDAAAGGIPQALTTFTPPGVLEPEKTYYWRVDEFDVTATHKGPVWSFTTAREGGGIKGEYFNNENLTGVPVLTRIDDLINFYWNPGPNPPPGINEDYFSIRWTGELEAPFSEPFTFITGTDDGARVYLDGKRIINDWGAGHDYAEVRSDPIDLVEGQRYALIMEGFELGGEAEWRLFWQSPSVPRQVIPQAALSLLVHAYAPKPANGTQGVNLMSELSWSPGEFATSHEVYVGADADVVANATKASSEYKGSKALGEESLDLGLLDFDTTYYWRVDEVNATNPDSPWTGGVWSFWTGDFLVVDDFETYDDVDPLPGEAGQNRIFDKWIDGFGTATNGALVGNDLPPYAETTIVNSGAQSMIYSYDLTGKFAEATLTLVFPKDWTTNGVTKLSLQVRGSSANSADQIFVALGNSVVYHPDAAATQLTGWNEWVIDLADFAGVNLSNVGSITIGIGTRNVPDSEGTGTMYFDDIRLIP